MHCTRCGHENDDQARFCRACNKKLRSDYEPPPEPSGPTLEFLEEMGHESLSPRLLPYYEAWVYVILLSAVAVWCLFEGRYQPLFIAIPLVAILAKLRRI